MRVFKPSILIKMLSICAVLLKFSQSCILSHGAQQVLFGANIFVLATNKFLTKIQFSCLERQEEKEKAVLL